MNPGVLGQYRVKNLILAILLKVLKSLVFWLDDQEGESEGDMSVMYSPFQVFQLFSAHFHDQKQRKNQEMAVDNYKIWALFFVLIAGAEFLKHKK